MEIWKEKERQINERFRISIEIKYHNVIMGFNPENCKNHAAISTIIMAVKKRKCYKDRLKTSLAHPAETGRPKINNQTAEVNDRI